MDGIRDITDPLYERDFAAWPADQPRACDTVGREIVIGNTDIPVRAEVGNPALLSFDSGEHARLTPYHRAISAHGPCAEADIFG